MQDKPNHPGRDSIVDPVHEQYRDDRRLRSRYAVHQEFSTAKTDYLDWIFNHISQHTPSNVLDLGCGPGYLWQRNEARVPAGWSIILGDRSRGMLSTAGEKLQRLAGQIDYVMLDGDRLPFKEAGFDSALALHVLHHVEDLGMVLAEIKRVLTPDGTLFAVTNGERHMLQFRKALDRCGVQTSYFRSSEGFSLQAGEEQLQELFSRVECIHYKDALEVTRVGPLLDYARSGIPESQLERLRAPLARLERHWNLELQRGGAIRIEKETGLFIAR